MRGGKFIFEENDPLFTKQRANPNADEFESLLAQRPTWIVRNGNWILTTVTAVIILLAIVLKFPGRITGEAIISFKNPSVTLVSRSSGKIQALYVSNHEKVKKHQPICVIENPTPYQDIVLLKLITRQVDSLLASNVNASIPLSNFPHRFGDVQSNYAQLQTSLSKYNYLITNSPHSQRIVLAEKELLYLQMLDTQFTEKGQILNEKLRLEKKKFAIDSILNAGKVIASTEFDASQARLLDERLKHQDNIFKQIENKKLQSNLQREVSDLKNEQSRNELELRRSIQENIRAIEGYISTWEDKYLVKSPIDGTVLMLKYWKENQVLEQSEPVALIMPDINDYTCRIKVPIEGSGKIKANQSALIKLSAYPFHEYGTIRATVVSIPQVAVGGFYYLDAQLEHGLLTSRKKTIPNAPQLEGQVEILTDPRNIFQKFFEKLLTMDVIESQ